MDYGDFVCWRILHGELSNREDDIPLNCFAHYSQTISAISTFFLAMSLHPDVQSKARKELDEIVGADRLPTFKDRERLPYVEAVMSEVFRWVGVRSRNLILILQRWAPPIPSGVPHESTEDDIYDGLFIPKGSVIWQNIWSDHIPSVLTYQLI
jgi:cytochrome P450